MATLAQRLTDFAARVATQFNSLKPRLLPAGGLSGQVLTRAGAADFGVSWSTPQGTGFNQISDKNYVATVNDSNIQFTTLTASRTVTLLPSSSVPAGFRVRVGDLTGSCSTSVAIIVQVTSGSSNSINGQSSKSYYAPFTQVTYESDGVSRWTVVHRTPSTWRRA